MTPRPQATGLPSPRILSGLPLLALTLLACNHAAQRIECQTPLVEAAGPQHDPLGLWTRAPELDVGLGDAPNDVAQGAGGARTASQRGYRLESARLLTQLLGAHKDRPQEGVD